MNWKEFLEKYSAELLSDEEIRDQMPEKVVRSGWLGFNGATEKELQTLESRLRVRLPESYREFLKCSNGWRWSGRYVDELLCARKVNWFRVEHEDWIQAYSEPAAGLPEVTEKQHRIYGAKQDSCVFRTEYLKTALAISRVADGIYLLNPQVKDKDGEWEAWFFANWLPGAVRYRSFREMMEAEERSFSKELQAQVKEKTPTKKGRGIQSIRKAQSAARGGQIDAAIEALERFAESGDDEAAASLAEIYAFTGEWAKVIKNAGRLIANPGAGHVENIFCEMVNLIGCAGHVSGDWASVIKVAEEAIRINNERKYDKGLKSLQERYDKIFRNLISYAKRGGTEPHELIAIFGISDPTVELTEVERKNRYEEQVRDVDINVPVLKKNPDAKAEYFFSLARFYKLEDEELRLYEAHGRAFEMTWDAAEYVSRAYVKRGQMAQAGKTVESHVSQWSPLVYAQVAPVALLIDEELRKVMTPERCRLVLATPRGPEGAKKPS